VNASVKVYGVIRSAEIDRGRRGGRCFGHHREVVAAVERRQLRAALEHQLVRAGDGLLALGAVGRHPLRDLAASLAAGDFAGVRWPHVWWLYVGGALGAVYIALAAVAVAELGVLRLSLATVAGQLVAAVVLDVVWPSPGITLRYQTVVGAALTLVAVAVTGIGRRQAAAAAA